MKRISIALAFALLPLTSFGAGFNCVQDCLFGFNRAGDIQPTPVQTFQMQIDLLPNMLNVVTTSFEVGSSVRLSFARGGLGGNLLFSDRGERVGFMDMDGSIFVSAPNLNCTIRMTGPQGRPSAYAEADCRWSENRLLYSGKLVRAF